MSDGEMTCLSECLDRKAALEPGWGGPGEVTPLLDDAVPPGPGEEVYERLEDEWVQRRLLVLEETTFRRVRGAQGQDSEGKGAGEKKGKWPGRKGGDDKNGW